MKLFKLIRRISAQPENVFHQALIWGNIPFLKDNPAYLKKVIQECFLSKFKHPYILYTFNGRIRELEEFVLSEKQLTVLKNQTFHIFLYEPISFFTDSFNRGFYSEFPSNLDVNTLRSYELESIEIFAKKYNLNIIVCTCEYEIQLLQPQYQNFKLVCFDAFIRRDQRKRINPFQHYFPNLSLIDRKFWSGNWRYTLHRHIIMAYLANFEGYYSWHFKCNFANIENNEWFNFKDLPNYITRRLECGSKIADRGYAIDNNELQVTVDELNNVYKPSLHPNTGNDDKLWESYDKSFCAVVTETRFAQPFANFSEKTLMAIRAQIPFIVVSPPNTLKYIKEFGFQTFDKWWDESYDQEQDHEKRMIKILNLIEFINSKPLDELIKIRKEMKSVLAHNYKINQKIQYNTTYM